MSCRRCVVHNNKDHNFNNPQHQPSPSINPCCCRNPRPCCWSPNLPNCSGPILKIYTMVALGCTAPSRPAKCTGRSPAHLLAPLRAGSQASRLGFSVGRWLLGFDAFDKMCFSLASQLLGRESERERERERAGLVVLTTLFCNRGLEKVPLG